MAFALCSFFQRLLARVDYSTNPKQPNPLVYPPTSKDSKRDEHLESLGLKILHFQDLEVKHNIDAVVDEIRKVLEWLSVC
jgi:hypothetical protein